MTPALKQHPEGAPCWFELGTSDQNAAKQFYTKLFGWTFKDSPLPDGSVYTTFLTDEGSVGSTYTLMPDMIAQGIPPHWMVYFNTATIDEMAANMTELGGRIIHQPFDVMEHGRMAICADPTGAVFSLWQPNRHPGATETGKVNTVCWSELATRDTAAAEKFYKKLFGWETKPSASAGAEYTEFAAGGQWLGGIMKMDAQWEGVPPYWGIYMMVDDCDRVAEQARSLGGKVHHGPFDAPGVGRIAILADPQGAMFSIIKLDHPM